MTADLNCLSHWFPLIEAACLPVPRTTIVRMPDEAMHEFHRMFDGELRPFGGPSDTFLVELRRACDAMGYPCFLRTGQGSGKHQWKDTCYIASADDLPQHVWNLIEWSECVDMIGLRWDVWAVRELLPTRAMFTLPLYGDMPVCREFRAFVRDGVIQCLHPYWPKDALRQGFRSAPEGFEDQWHSLCRVYEDGDEFDGLRSLAGLAVAAGKAVGGYWSVDIIETKRGWFVTDMAIGERSFHWPGCENLREESTCR